MRPGDRAGDGQAKTHSARVRAARRLDAIEWLERLLQIRFREPGAGIRHLDHGRIAIPEQPHPGPLAVPDRVVDQIGEQTLQSQAVGLQHQRLGRGDPHVGAQHAGVVDGALQGGPQVDPLAGPDLARLLHEGQGRGQHLLHLNDIAPDRLPHLGGKGLDLETDPGKRRAQIVRHGADRAGALLHVTAQPRLHLVEGLGRAPEFRRS